MATVADWTTGDSFCLFSSRQVEDGRAPVQELAAPPVLTGYLPAAGPLTPRIILTLSLGDIFCRNGMPPGLTREGTHGWGQALFVWRGRGTTRPPSPRRTLITRAN
jgi:hypothetical protein